MAEDDKYTYPGSGGVLVNSFGIRDAIRLDEAMNDTATIEMLALRRDPVPERIGFEYLRSIHERMFRPIVPGIAGKIRDVDVQATGTGIPYCRPEFIDENIGVLFGKLDREDYLVGLAGEEFATRLAERWGELSAIHPFRDGNTRSQTVYITALAERAGHPIDWERVDVDTLRTLRLHAVTGRDRPLADYLADRLISLDDSKNSAAPLDPELQRIVDVTRLDFPSSALATRPPVPDASRSTGDAPSTPRRDRNRDLGYGL